MIRFIYFSYLVIGLLSCVGKKNLDLIKTKTKPSVSFKDYFRINKEDKFLNFSDFVIEFNKEIKLSNEIGDSAVLEIRIISSQIFGNTNYYRMVLNKKGIWAGEKRVFEYLTCESLSYTNFIPKSGWQNFENTIAENDILHSGNSFLKTPMKQKAFHPRMYVFQVLQPNSTHILDYESFYEYSKMTKSIDKEFSKMKNIMDAIF